MELTGKVIVITGAGSGIGKAMAQRFAEESPAGLALADLDAEAVKAVSEAVGALPIEVDVSEADANRRMVETVEDELGPIDLFCANAGYGHTGSEQDNPEVWNRMWQVNLMSHVHAAKELIPGWVARGEGYWLSTASAAGLLTNLKAAQYSVTKHAAVAFAEWLAITYGDAGIKVSCLCPQFVNTPLVDDMDGLEELIQPVLIEPPDVAETVVQGLSDERFLILPHAEVVQYFQNKANDYDRWIGGMRKLQRSVFSG